MDRFAAPLELKFSDAQAATGEFEGYAAVFGNTDSYGDVIAPRAFENTLAQWKARGLTPPLYFNHAPFMGGDTRPVGKLTAVSEDSKGLAVSGKMAGLDTEQGRYNFALLRDGAMQGMSFGFRIPPGGSRKGQKATDPKRTITKIDLFEVSIVDNPANHMAQISALKSAAGRIKTIREFEDFLRDEGGFSHGQAKAIASSGFKSMTEPRDEDETDKYAALAARFRALRTA